MTQEDRSYYIKERGCVGKIRFKSMADALALKRDKRRRPRGGGNDKKTLRPYKCPHCDGYHLGHSKRKPISKFKRGAPIPARLVTDTTAWDL